MRLSLPGPNFGTIQPCLSVAMTQVSPSSILQKWTPRTAASWTAAGSATRRTRRPSRRSPPRASLVWPRTLATTTPCSTSTSSTDTQGSLRRSSTTTGRGSSTTPQTCAGRCSRRSSSTGDLIQIKSSHAAGWLTLRYLFFPNNLVSRALLCHVGACTWFISYSSVCTRSAYTCRQVLHAQMSLWHYSSALFRKRYMLFLRNFRNFSNRLLLHNFFSATYARTHLVEITYRKDCTMRYRVS